MTHENDVRIAEGLQNMSLPTDPAEAMAAWRGAVNDAVTEWHRARGCDFPDLNDLDRRGVIDPIGFCFPHYFILPHVQQRVVLPNPSAGTRADAVRDLVAHPLSGRPLAGQAHPHPSRCAPDDPSWPTIPAQDFSNLPRQQKGLHAKGFEYMRLSDQIEGLISNFERVIDGFLAGLPYERLVPAIQCTNTTIDVPVADLGLSDSACRIRSRRTRSVGQVGRPAHRGQRRRRDGRRAGRRSTSGIEPLVVEKQDLVGGSTGMSGGMVWLPNNPLMRADGIADSHEDGLAYFDDVVGDIGAPSSPARRETFLTAGYEMIDFLAAQGRSARPVSRMERLLPESQGRQRGRALASRESRSTPPRSATGATRSSRRWPRTTGSWSRPTSCARCSTSTGHRSAFAVAMRVFLRTNSRASPSPRPAHQRRVADRPDAEGR